MISEEIRKLIISNLQKGRTEREIADIFEGNPVTVRRPKKLYEEQWNVKPKTENCGRKNELDEAGLEKLKTLVLENPDLTLEEIRETMHLSIKKEKAEGYFCP